ncbi:hypothetical protein EYM_03785 [Ignicoccus islandicus DSM 13165]|uniref:Metanogen output domain-containing protein n=1 Tax=Ignicoccus islandicus DSM 13165 TaxID=940295 RepID=A0A0U3F9V3_9CREN|nr:methanogen output domain 1-containing protein [Ignicoccus islandicus]ALU12441.1 hypothetical protein EYM_03785 [Ignicoccus islandicus DSM 13165]
MPENSNSRDKGIRIDNVDIETVAKAFANFSEKFLFDILPEELSKYIGEGASVALIYNIVKKGAKETLGEEIKKVMEIKGLEDALKACYLPYALVGMDFEHEEEKVSDNEVIVKVTKCPHFKYTKTKPFACVACAAVKAGIIEDLRGKPVQVILKKRKVGSTNPKIVIEIKKHMPSGDEYCEFHVKEM